MFDEPDSGLDPVRTAFLSELIRDLNGKLGSTMVVVTHDIATARRVADYIGMIYLRKLVQFGTAKECFESDQAEVRQFLSGDTEGPIGMSEEKDSAKQREGNGQVKAESSYGRTAEETEEMEKAAGAPDEGDGARSSSEESESDQGAGDEGEKEEEDGEREGIVSVLRRSVKKET
jgi:ABC-type multidrug transport system ATPase subunit